MRATALFIIGILYGYASMLAQIQEPVKFTVEDRRVSDNQLELVFSAIVEKGWHVYGTDIPEDGPTAAALTIIDIHGLKTDGKLIAQGKELRVMDEMYGMELSYFEGKVSFVQRFTITDSKYSAEGYLSYGACNEENCIPPTDVDFSITGEGNRQGKLQEGMVTQEGISSPEDVDSVVESVSDTLASMQESSAREFGNELWSPVVDELRGMGESGETHGDSLAAIFLLGFLGGLLALLTPCVWPIIPMTVSFFLKRGKDRSEGIRDAVTYGISIVVIYVLLGLLVTMVFGASALNALSTNAVFNVFFFLMLLVFAASFLGGF